DEPNQEVADVVDQRRISDPDPSLKRILRDAGEVITQGRPRAIGSHRPPLPFRRRTSPVWQMSASLCIKVGAPQRVKFSVFPRESRGQRCYTVRRIPLPPPSGDTWMFSLHDRPYSLCDRITRRELMRIGGLNLLGLSLPALLRGQAQA